VTLDELLALLPDNTTGEISPADLRTIVTDLYNYAHARAAAHPYKWTTGTSGDPGTGKVGTDTGWTSGATVLRISEITDDGTTLGFGFIDESQASAIVLSDSTGRELRCTPTGPSVDQGTYRTIPVSVSGLSGTAPSNNAALTVSIQLLLSEPQPLPTKARA
jgi:hypothetical protein